MTAYEDIPQGAAEGTASAESVTTTTTASVAGLPCDNPSASYWLQSPSPVLLGHRSTPELPAEADVVVIGSGITGSFAADKLVGDSTNSGSVLLLEAREACSGATGRNGGHCQPMIYDSAPDVAAFELATFRFLERFVADNRIAACDWRTLPEGGVHGYLDQDLFDAAAAVVDALGQTHPDLAEQVAVVRGGAPAPVKAGPQNKPVTLDDLRLRPGVVGALVQRHAASVWPYKLVAWVLERLVQTHPSSRFNLQTNTPATSLVRAEDGRWLVATPRGTVAAKAVLLATNGYTSHLLPPALADLIVPVRGQVAALVPPTATVTKTVVSKTATSSSSSTVTTTGPADLLRSSYVFMGHDPEIADGRRERDEYLVQRPFTGAAPAVSATASASASGASSASASASAPATATAGGHLIFGGGRERAAHDGVGVWRDDEVEPAVAAFLRSHLAPVLDVGATGEPPAPLTADYEWTGIMGYSRDHHPWVGRVPSEVLGGLGVPAGAEEPSSLYIAAGFTGHGMPSTSLCGRAVARMIRKDLKWTSAADDDAEDHPVPACHLMTTERLAHVRATCSPVAVSDKKGFLADLQELLEERRAGQ